MLDLIRKLLGSRRVVPSAPEGFKPILPSSEDAELDEWDDDDEVISDLASIGGVGCVIIYLDSGSDESVRRITCRRLSSKGPVIYLQAYCHERGALRTFRMDRIACVTCGETGEVFDNPAQFFSEFKCEDDGGAAVGWGLGVQLACDLRASLNVLAFLARADGRVCDAEAGVIRDWCKVFAYSIAGKAFDVDAAAKYARKLAPDGETFFVSLRRFERQGAYPRLRPLVLSAAATIVRADGEVDETEAYLWEKVEAYLKEPI